MWLTDGFSVTFFGRWRGQCAHTLIPVWLPYTVINVCVGGGGNCEHWKTQKVWKTSIFNKGGGEHQWPYWIS